MDKDSFHIISNKLKLENAARGPDAQHSLITRFPENSGGHTLELYASELRLRGNAPVVQPHVDGEDMLVWNGEVFEGLKLGPVDNDGQKVFERFRVALSTESLSISEMIGAIEGPYAFVFYQGSSKKLYFARDPLGRRSLLIHKPTLINPIFLLASVSAGEHDGYEFEELSTDGIFVLDIDAFREPENFAALFHNSLSIIPRASSDQIPFGVTRKVNRSLPPDNLPIIHDLDVTSLPEPLLDAMEQLISQLDKSVMLRVTNIPLEPRDRDKAKVAVLFSGGIDSTILAFLAHRHISMDEPIDLLNVAFENPRKMRSQLDGKFGPKERRHDSRGTGDRKSASYMVPDRVTGLQELEELKRTCPGRVWNFVEVDVPYEESQAAMLVVKKIMYPSKTVMDLSLSLALYFASRGVGHVRSSLTSECRPYTSSAKVVLSGLGSDELLGGYGRHRTAFVTGFWEGVINELQLELDRIPTRNLGRDDRIISSHGKETRHPFLSLSVVSFLARLPVHLKLDPRLELGIGDKMLLRLAARKVGLVDASTRKKRAMQFGSHSARMEGGSADRRGDLLISTA